MNTTFKKIFAMLVCAVLMLSLVPTLAVSAEETEVTYLQNGLVSLVRRRGQRGQRHPQQRCHRLAEQGQHHRGLGHHPDSRR